MTEIKNKNYHRQVPGDFENNMVIRNCNISQEHPNTTIGVGIKGLKFINCNLMNCKIPIDAKVEGCLTVQKEIEPDPVIMDEDNIKTELENLQLRYGDKVKTEAKKYFNLTDVKVIL